MKRVLLRVDFNVPFKNGRVADDFRIRAALPEIKNLVRWGYQVFLITHLEENNKTPHLPAIKKALERLLKTKVGFMEGRIPAKPVPRTEKIVLFDNIRLNPGEKKNDLKFARNLASWGDLYINDAFSVSHRKHASIVSLPKYLPNTAGPLLKKEAAELSKFFKPKHPFLFVLGGKKFETKEPLVSKFLNGADAIFVGGALGNTFLALRGVAVGASKVENIKIPDKILWNNKILLPEDVVVERNGKKKTILFSEVKKNDLIYDAGPKTVRVLGELAKKAKLILWNGTLGFCENSYAYGTKELAKAVGTSKAFRLVGGGDTVAAIRQMKLEKNFDFLSTGGGAMLEFLAKGTLPGIEALKKK